MSKSTQANSGSPAPKSFVPDSSSQGSFIQGILFGLLAALLWGAWPVVSRFGVQHSLDAYDIAALRFAVAGIILLPLMLKRGLKGVSWPGVLVLAAGAGVPYVLLVVIGLTFAPAGHMGVITPSWMMTMSALGGWLFLKDRPTPNRFLGFAIIILGVALIGWQGLAVSQKDQWIGHLLFLAGGSCWASYTVGTRYFAVDPLHATGIVAVVSMVLYLPVYLLLLNPAILTAPWEETLFQGIFQGIFSSILALLFYTKAVAILGPARGAVFGSLVPGVAVLLAFPVLGEVPTALEMTGVAVVSLGMVTVLGLFRFKRPAPQPQ